MTNSEAKEVFKKLDYNCARCRRELSPICDEAKELAIFALEENTKLKAEIEALRNELKWIYEKRDLALAENEQLKESRNYISEANGSLVRINDKQDREITKLKDENEQLKAELEKSEITRNKQIDVLLQEIEQLKSELEQSVNNRMKLNVAFGNNFKKRRN